MSGPTPGAHPLQPMYQPSAYIAPPPRHSFAHSSSAKRRRSLSPPPSSSGSDDGDDEAASLDDPLDLDLLIANEGGDITQGRRAANDELEDTNRGMKMLLRMGWSAGQGLGKDGQGRVAPLDPGNNTGGHGIGKLAHDTKILDSTTLTTRRLASEQQAAETADQAAARRHKAAFEAKVKADVLSSLANFRCDTCGGKQYSNARLYNEHLNSYDHHHQARAVALKKDALERARASGETDKRREKEKKREEKALAKLMGAAGVKAPAGGIVAAAPAPAVKPDGPPIKAGGWAKVGGGGAGGGFSSAGFAPVGGAVAPPVAEPVASTSGGGLGGGGGFKKGGWSSFTTMKTAQGPASTAAAVPVTGALPSVSGAESITAPKPAPAFVSGRSFSLSVEDGLASRAPSPSSSQVPPSVPSVSHNLPAAFETPQQPAKPPPPPPPSSAAPPPPPPSSRPPPPPPPHASEWQRQPPPPTGQFNGGPSQPHAQQYNSHSGFVAGYDQRPVPQGHARRAWDSQLPPPLHGHVPPGCGPRRTR